MRQIQTWMFLVSFLAAGCVGTHRGEPLQPESAQPSAVFQRPLHGPITVMSRFGPRGKRFHTGIDLRVNRKAHDPIYASRDGRVVFLGKLSGYGTIISLEHDDGFYTRYAHLHQVFVKKGERVKVGEKIALMGKTGRASTEHLHFEILTPKSRFLDPYPLLFGRKPKN